METLDINPNQLYQVNGKNILLKTNKLIKTLNLLNIK